MAAVINQQQSAFVPGRLITDNVIIEFECMHWIRSNKKNLNGFGALKLDMSKAYDRVEWIFLQKIMAKLGFAAEFVNLIIRCVSSVSYSIRVNHSIYGTIIPQRGLRRGDPLSPYLFAICAQGLSVLLVKAEAEKKFKGIKIANSCPSISHLFFADDSLIFFRASEQGCVQIKNCLQSYERGSGQLVNYDKSAITFGLSSGCSSLHKSALTDRWIPGLISGCSSLHKSGSSSLLVKHLISDIGSWNVELVRATFPSFEADYILDIPLGRRLLDDLRYWKWDAKGQYSVKSGYLLEIGYFDPPGIAIFALFTFVVEDDLEPSHPPKVRIFLWLAFHDFIPTELNLLRHHVPVNGICSLCGSFTPSTSHCLIICPIISKLWKGTLFWSLLKNCRLWSFMDCGLHLAAILTRNRFELFAMYAWAIWKETCRWNHDTHKPRQPIAIAWVIPYFEEFQKARVANLLGSQIAQPVQLLRWSKPPPGHFRLDVDVGYNERRGRFSVGAVIRDHSGYLRAASSCGIRQPGSVLAAEIIALNHGLLLVNLVGFQNVLVFSDSSLAVQAVTLASENRGPIGTLIADVCSLLDSECFISLAHTSRVANKVAHSIAQYALANPSPLRWIEGGFPSWIMDVAMADL